MYLSLARFIGRGVALAALCWSCASGAQTVALTFDDGLNPDQQADAARWNQQILRGLQDAGVSAMLFPSLVRMGGANGMGLVRDWASAGHAVGNHTARHRSVASASVSLADFVGDVQEADTVLRRLPTWQPMLRFPYLKEGDTVEKRDGMRDWMQRNGYRAAPVSIDASDWYYNQVYLAHTQAGAQGKADAVKRAYIAHLLGRAAYYDGLAQQVLGRSPAHVMLLHTNAINAQALPAIIAAFRAQGWALVPPLRAFDDAIYATPPNTLPAGESVIWALAKAQGQGGLRYPAEDSVYETPLLQAQGLLP